MAGGEGATSQHNCRCSSEATDLGPLLDIAERADGTVVIPHTSGYDYGLLAGHGLDVLESRQ